MNHSTCIGIAFVTVGILTLAQPAPAQTTHTVELTGMVFIPGDLTINVGDTVHWEWRDGFHNVESGIVQGNVAAHDGNFRSGDPIPAAGAAFDLTFDAAFLAAKPMPGNVYPYYCIVHASMNMVGAITVQVGGCTTAGDCDDGNVCTDDSCDPATGCVNTDNTAACDDGEACTTGDTCSLGVCVGGAAPNCDDGNVCTDDSCNPATGCVNTDNTAACDDGDACTTGAACSLGVCVGGAAPNCGDGNVCTDDSCNPATGCVNTNNTALCDDGNTCTTGDVCSGGVCAVGTPIDCDDGDPCTADTCVDGTCNYEPISDCCVQEDDCDDANACTDDGCVENECVHILLADCTPCTTANACDDGDDCTDDACSNGVCVFTPIEGCAPRDGVVEGNDDDNDPDTGDEDGQNGDDESGPGNDNEGDDNSMSSSDEDGDGVSDDLDQCSDTPVGEPVDGNGCSEDQAEMIDDTAPAPLPEEDDSVVSTQSRPQFCGLFGMISFLCIFIGLAGFRTMLRRPGRSRPRGGGP